MQPVQSLRLSATVLFHGCGRGSRLGDKVKISGVDRSKFIIRSDPGSGHQPGTPFPTPWYIVKEATGLLTIIESVACFRNVVIPILLSQLTRAGG
jgi:hypothetical protein